MVRKILRGFAKKTQTIPVKIYVLGIGGLLTLGYVLLFVVPKPVVFSYAGETCLRELTLLPSQHRVDNTRKFTVEHKDVVGIFATRTCFTPTSAPQPGTAALASAPFGGFLFQHHYEISVPAAPHVMAAATTPATVALTKPLAFSIDRPDTVFTYKLVNGDKTQVCEPAQTQLTCYISRLGLAQGAEHTVRLTRNFNDTTTDTLVETTIAVLPAVTITDSSIKNNQVVYDKPRVMTIVVDKSLVSAHATLELVDASAATAIPAQVTVNDKQISVTVANDLPREKTVRLTAADTEAVDGSTLVAPYVISFTTSGGPKVVNVNIGSSNVAPSAQVVVSFDQPLDPAIDVQRFAWIEGASSNITKQGNTVVFSLSNLPRCSPFRLVIAKGITSASNGLPSTTDWAYSSRISCRATSTIGYSVKGRPIVAYFYGSGPTTILFTGGMHGSEPSGQQTMQAWANYLDTHAPEIPAGRQVVIVPNTNPDGIAAGTRLNARGVNIDRNFDTSDWQADIQTTNGVLAGGGGASPMSEPETRAIAVLTAQLSPRVEVSFHAAGRLVGANDYADSRDIGSLYASLVGYATMFGANAEDVMGYTFSGQYEDYIAQKVGKPAILIELPSASGNYLNSQLPALWRMVRL